MTASLPSLSGASSGHFDIVIAHNAELPSFEGRPISRPPALRPLFYAIRGPHEVP